MSLLSYSFDILLSCPSHPYQFFLFTHTATTELYTLSLHDALPILSSGTIAAKGRRAGKSPWVERSPRRGRPSRRAQADRKSTRLNSSHLVISYAVFCLKKKKKNINNERT